MKQKSIAAVTLGCKVNYAETSSIVDILVGQGWQMSANANEAELVVIHTCAVTAEAERKSRQQIRKIIRNNPKSRIVVTGCYAQLDPGKVASIDGVSLVLGMAEKFDCSWYMNLSASCDHSSRIHVAPVSALKTVHVASSLLSQKEDGRTRAFLKVQDGCSYGCAYCTIPLARGRSRSVPLQEVIDRAWQLAETGYREIVLTGINMADYRSGNAGFAELLGQLDRVAIERIRISSVEPQLLGDDVIDIVAASGKIMPHFHLPLQSGSDRILREMGRQYDTGFYRERLLKAVSMIPGCAVGADVMVGYPGESEEDFEEMYRFIEALPVAYLHLFTCSPRPGTRLFRQLSEGGLKRVSSAIAGSRAVRLGILGRETEKRFASDFIGRKLRVLFEERTEGPDGLVTWSGYSENYLRVQVAGDAETGASIIKGGIHEVFIEGYAEGLHLQGRLVS